MMETRDKRDYFRLTDTIHLAHRIVTKKDLQEHEAEFFFSPDPDFNVSQEIQILELESTEILRKISDTNRQLGSFLHNLNRRVELISHRLMSLNLDRELIVRSNTEISEGGISFTNQELLNVGDFLALKLQFQPSLLGLTCFAEVRDCLRLDNSMRTGNGDGYRVGARFINPDHTTQRLLSRHIIRRQSEERRIRLREQNRFDDE